MGKAWLRENAKLLGFLVLLGFVRTAVADWNPVPSGSMRPTILEGDVVLVDRLAYDFKLPLTDVVLARIGDPARGDIVTFFSPVDGMRLIKRVVAVPGDTVEMRDNHLVVNGVAIDYAPIGEVAETLGNGRVLDAERVRERFGAKTHTIQWLHGVASRSSFGPVIIPQDRYLMLGDNRDDSEDSRYIGLVPRDKLIGRASRILVSVAIKEHWQPRVARFGASLRD